MFKKWHAQCWFASGAVWIAGGAFWEDGWQVVVGLACLGTAMLTYRLAE